MCADGTGIRGTCFQITALLLWGPPVLGQTQRQPRSLEYVQLVSKETAPSVFAM